MRMDSTSSCYNPSAGTRAITIPLHGGSASSSSMSSNRSSRRQNAQPRRPCRPDRLDSDIGNASGSSLGSDWTASPASAPRPSSRSGVGLQVSMPSPPATNVETDALTSQHSRKDKQRAVSDDLPPNTLPPLFTSSPSPLGPSMISSSAYKSVNLNSHYDPDSKEPARLITYTKHSQGFTWNDELFLPSYLLGRHRYRGGSGSARRRWAGEDEDDGMGDFDEDGERCPVTDIFVTDEEAAAMMP